MALNPFVLADPKLEALREELDTYQRARNRDVDAPPTLADLRTQHAEYTTLAGRVAPFMEIIERELDEWGKKLDPTKADDSAQRAKAAYMQFVESRRRVGAWARVLLFSLAMELPNAIKSP